MLQGFSVGDLHLREPDSANIEDRERVEVTARITSEKPREIALETIVGRLNLESCVTAVRWRTVTTLV